MPRQKKDGTYLNVRIESSIYDRLCGICDEAGQTKTVVVERALENYFEKFEEQKKILDKLEDRK